ncbi:MAG: FUSC family protein [Curtobacterium sp.]
MSSARSTRARHLVEALLLALATVVAWYLVTPPGHLLLGADDADAELAGMWSVVGAVFVFSDSVRSSRHSFVSRMIATLISSTLCLLYLLVFPVTPWGIAGVVGLGAVVLSAVHLQAETVTTSITTAVVLVVADLDAPGAGWQDPLVRVAATVVGGAVGLAAAWCVARLVPVVPASAR